MNERRRGTREESRKQALDSAWSVEMSKLTRDGTAEPVSRDQMLRRERGQRIINYLCSVAGHEQDWQPCPVVKAIHTNIVLNTHIAGVTYTYIYIYAYYTTTVNRARTYVSPPKKYTGTWYTWLASLPRTELISPGGWPNISMVGAIFVPSPPKTGTKLLLPAPPQSLNGSYVSGGRTY